MGGLGGCGLVDGEWSVVVDMDFGWGMDDGVFDWVFGLLLDVGIGLGVGIFC